MYVKWFSFEDYGTLKMFHERRNLPCPEWGDLPQIGVIVEGCAALFMWLTDGDFVFLEGAITDPKIDPRLSDAALEYAIKKLTAKAKTMGFNKVLGYTQVPSMVQMVQRLGWTSIDIPYTMVFKSIKDL